MENKQGIWTSMSAGVKAVLLLITFAVAVLGLDFVGYLRLPARVDQNTTSIQLNSRAIERLVRNDSVRSLKLDAIYCVLLLPEGTSPLEARSRCP